MVRTLTKLDTTYAQGERRLATAWKNSSHTIPPEARQPARYIGHAEPDRGPYPFCLPADYASLSLLPEVRESALALFEELGIPWHPDGKGPSNHLLSSQVQCVNALGQMVAEPQRITRAFGELLGVAAPLQIEPGRFLTFEYIGDHDYFNEGEGLPRTRGSHCTSVDAAFLHRGNDGTVELILLEWKYTESYRLLKPDPEKNETRRRRYEEALTAPDSPVRSDLLDFVDLLDEPLYQLMRQQLLAHELEKSRAHGADRVRVVHVHPKANLAYQQSLHRETQRALGSTVSEVWAKLLRSTDRFVAVDNALFLDPAITSDEYLARYGPEVAE